MTPEQIDLEFAHITLDKQEKDGGKQAYHDAEYDAYDEDTEGYDSKLSDMPVNVPQVDPHKGQTVKIQNEDDWEDIETDGY